MRYKPKNDNLRFITEFVTGEKYCDNEKKNIQRTGCEKSIGPPCHTKFDLFSIVLGKSDETMPYRLDLGNSFGVVYIAVTYLVQELC